MEAAVKRVVQAATSGCAERETSARRNLGLRAHRGCAEDAEWIRRRLHERCHSSTTGDAAAALRFALQRRARRSGEER